MADDAPGPAHDPPAGTPTAGKDRLSYQPRAAAVAGIAKGSVPTRFEQEMDDERGRWLKRRFLWYVSISFLLTLPGLLFIDDEFADPLLFLGVTLSTLTLLVAAGVYVWRSPPKPGLMLRVSVWLYVLTGLVGLVFGRINAAHQFDLVASNNSAAFRQGFEAGQDSANAVLGGDSRVDLGSPAPTTTTPPATAPAEPVPEPAPEPPAMDDEQAAALAEVRGEVGRIRGEVAGLTGRLAQGRLDPESLAGPGYLPLHDNVIDELDDVDGALGELDEALDDLAAGPGPAEDGGRDVVAIDLAGNGPGVMLRGANVRVPQWSGAAMWAGLTLGGNFFFAHLIACLFIPWTFRESLVPGGIVLAMYGLILVADTMFTGLPWWLVVMFLAAAGAALLPGSLWCLWRESRFGRSFRLRYESQRYRKLSEELTGARKLHEAVLPGQRTRGAVRLAYVYEPMQQIGGDLLYVHGGDPDDDPDGAITAVLLDVTGHGIAAALTVNRLTGELERAFAENPSVTPGELMTRLNDYVHLTLSPHGVYVTGLAVRVTPHTRREPNEIGDNVCYASAGHPPMFVRRGGRGGGGDCETIDSTAFMLGVLGGSDFDAGEACLTLDPGDVLLIYTDGAAEARSPEGKMITTAGLRRMLAGCGPAGRPEQWPGALLGGVTKHRHAPPDDDTLIAAIYRPAEVA